MKFDLEDLASCYPFFFKLVQKVANNFVNVREKAKIQNCE